MPSMTLSAIRTKVQQECSLEEEVFMTDSELNGLINDAIRDVEANIHTLYEDYYLTSANLALVNGTATVSPPSDIYADKIREIHYDNGSIDYVVERIKDLKMIPGIESTEYYRYILINDATVGRKIKFYPTPSETSSTNVTIWYIRNAKELSLDADTCDIPSEFYNYVLWRVKLAVYQKEGNPMMAEAEKMVTTLNNLMVSTLSNRQPDDDNKVLMDLSFYEDFE